MSTAAAAGRPLRHDRVASEGRRVPAPLLLTLLGTGLVLAMLAAAGTGQLPIPLPEVMGSVLHRVGLDLGPLPAHPRGEDALWQVRFPRVAMAALVGASLAAGGALMQGAFGNPLAEPGVVGVSSGAAAAGALAIVFGLGTFGTWTVPAFAFAGGLATVGLVYLLAREQGRTEVVTLVLTGVALTAVTGAALAFLLFLADTQAREEIVFWTLGSLNGARWEQVGVVAPLSLAALLVALALAGRLDLLALGDRAARHVGVDVERLRLACLVLVAVLTAAAVSFSGIIAFVGLVVPHAMRMLGGARHALLLPASALAGALVLVIADLGARTLVAYADLPIGMLTSLVGGPFFFWLLRRERARAGGWA